MKGHGEKGRLLRTIGKQMSPVFKKVKRKDPKKFNLVSLILTMVEQINLETILKCVKDGKVMGSSQRRNSLGESDPFA